MRCSFIVPCGLALLLLTGCSSTNSNSSNSTVDSSQPQSSNPAPNTAGAAKVKGDFSSPKAAVETFIAASGARDAETLSRCFATESSGEFRKLREKAASPKELDELATFVEGAQILDVKERGETALVSVKFKKREEAIAMTKAADGWKIVDF